VTGLLVVALWLALALCFVPKHWWTQARRLLTTPRGDASEPRTRTPDDHPDLAPVELSVHDRTVLMELDVLTKWEDAR
jgi:hypothetical protein